MSNKLMNYEQIMQVMSATADNLKSLSEQVKKIPQLEERLTNLEDNTTLTSKERLGTKKAIELKVNLGLQIHNLTKESRKKMFSNIHRRIWNAFDVASYQDIPRGQYQNLLDYIRKIDFSEKEIERFKEKELN